MLLPPSSFKIVSIYSLGLSLSPECFLSFLSNVYIPICVGKMFKVMVFIFLENPLNIGIFTYASLFTQNLPPSCYHHSLDRGKLLTPPPGSIFFENLFPSTEERGGRNYDLHYQNQSETVKMTSNIGYLYFVWFLTLSNEMALRFYN